MEVNQEICEDLLQEIISSILMWSLDLIKISKGVKKHEAGVAQQFNSVLWVSQRKAALHQLGTPSQAVLLHHLHLWAHMQHPLPQDLSHTAEHLYSHQTAEEGWCPQLAFAFVGLFKATLPDITLTAVCTEQRNQGVSLYSVQHEGSVMVSLEKQKRI